MARRSPLPAVLALLFALLATNVSGQTSQMTFTLKAGAYKVGFRTIRTTDPTRTFDEAAGPWRPRPVQIYAWYPARPADHSLAMRYDEYIYRSAHGTRPARTVPTRAVAIRRFTNALGLFDHARLAAELGARTTAFLDAPPVPGRFPVVIYAPGFNAPGFDNSVLAEYLASNGYIVLASSSVGWHQRLMTSDPLGLEAQVRDLELGLSLTSTLPGADPTRVATLGYSWGGLACVLLQLRNPRIRAVVSLEGSIAYDWASFVRSPGPDLSRMDVPFLFLGQTALPADTARKYGIDTTFAFFEGLDASRAYRVSFPVLRHPEFSSLSLRLLAREAGEPDQSTANFGYEQISRFVRAFLDMALSGDSAAAAFFAQDPEGSGMPSGFATIERRQPTKPPRNLASFIDSLGTDAPTEATVLLSRLRALDPGYSLPEEVVNGWGYDLLAAGSTAGAVGAFSLNTAMYPESANAWDSLGESLMASGRTQEAITSYETALRLDPTNTNARRRIARLRAQSRQ